MSIGPEENEIFGSWEFVDGRAVEDEVSRRIRTLIGDELHQVATSSDGWG